MATTLYSRRRFVVTAGLAASGALLAACGAPPPAPTQEPAAPTTAPKPAATQAPAAAPTPAPAAPTVAPTAAPQPAVTQAAAPKPLGKEPIALRLWHWDTFLVEPYEKEGAEFTRQFSNITVKVEQTAAAEYPQKLTAAMAGGSVPDVIGLTVTRADFLLFATNKQLTPLLPLIQRDKFDLDDFYKHNLAQLTWKGTLYGLPYTWDTIIWYYNVDIFTKEKLKTPAEYWREGKWNWDTYVELAAQLARGSGTDKQWGSGVVVPTNLAAFLPLVWSNGGELFDAAYTKPTLSEPPTFGAYEFAFKVKQYAPGPEDARTGTAESGRLAIWPNWDVYYALYNGRVPFTYSLVPPPASPKGGANFFVGNAPGFGLPQGIKQPDAAWELEKFLMSRESLTRVFVASNTVPPRKSLATSEALFKQNPKIPDAAVITEIHKAKEKAAKNPPKISAWTEMLKAHSEEISLVWADKQALDAGVKKVEERWRTLLKEAEVDPATT
jgi:ABC-type glycerol-3-phosphate transport system substrate-binding protein